MARETAVRDASITLGGLRFHYRDWGDPSAPPVLLLHGAYLHAHSWDSVAAGLADRFHVLAVDLRGYGESDWAPDSTPSWRWGTWRPLSRRWAYPRSRS
jgi:pimeloyl-ACP methyl ester carboxylesterase